MPVADDALIDRESLDLIIDVLRARGLRTLGPVVRDGAIMQGEIESTSDLPEGWHDQTAPGEYRLTSDGSTELFGWAVGPASWKSEFFAPVETVWRATVEEGGVTVSEPVEEPVPVAIIAARPCEVAALGVLDHVLRDGAVADNRYTARRDGAFVVAAECGSPSSTCFCTSMGTGPGASTGYDLAVTELVGPTPSGPSAGGPSAGGPTPSGPSAGDEGTGDAGSKVAAQTFYVQVGSAAGAEVLALVPHRPADDAARSGRQAVVHRATERMGRSLDTEGLPGLLARSLEHPRWADVADRCLSCGNCTLVCPTCFCSDVKDVTDVSGAAERQRQWSSCFDLDHSYLHGGAVRPTTSSRYRQWMTHKLSTWWDQFDESGCVGCGRCIAWCPVGIDITEEAAAIRATDGARVLDSATDITTADTRTQT
jgi:ferredoxin